MEYCSYCRMFDYNQYLMGTPPAPLTKITPALVNQFLIRLGKLQQEFCIGNDTRAYVAIQHQSSICIPSSTTRSVGIL